MIALLAVAALTASAGPFPPIRPPPFDPVCSTYDDAFAAAPLMRVTAAKVQFQDKPQPCPEGAAPCAWRRKGYLTAGDVVLVGQAGQGFRCVYYGAPSGRLTAGFLPDAALRPVKDREGTEPLALVGRWRGEDASTIVISRAGTSGLRAKGEASFQGNVGQFDAVLQLSPDGLKLRIGECEVIGRQRGPYLAVRDNNGCGGANVSFGGPYMKAR